MKRMLAFAAGAAALLGMTGLAVAQPAYGPNAAYYSDYGYGYAAPAYPTPTYYPDYATPAPPPPAIYTYAPPAVTYAQPYYWDQTHMNGGASRAYPYGGGPKPN